MSKRGIILTVSAVIIVAAIIVAAVFIINDNNNNNQQTDSKCTVVFDPNCVITTADQYTVLKQEPNTEVTAAKSPTRADCEFLGWYMDKECTTEAVFPYKVTENVSFYAKWTVPEVSSYFNDKFYESNWGQYLINSHKQSVSAEEVKPLGLTNTSQYVASGLTHFVYHIGDEYCVFIDEDFTTAKYTIPDTDVSDIRVHSLNECNYEFLEVKIGPLYYVYDNEGNRFGPSIYAPEVMLCSMIDLGNVCYTFNDDGTIAKYFDIDSQYRPTSGDVDSEDAKRTYCQIKEEINDGKVVKKAYILDNRFNAKKSFTYPENSIYDRFIFLGNGKYLFQYAVETSDSDAVSFVEDGKNYKLISQVVDSTGKMKDTGLNLPAITPTNLTYKFGLRAFLSDKISNIISFYTIDPETKELQKDGKILTSLNSDGTIYKIFILSADNYNFASVMPLVNTDYLRVWYTDTVDGKPVAYEHILDPVNKKVVISDVKSNICRKYFIKDTHFESDNYDIYDANGVKVGDYTGKTYAGATHNNLFFSDNAGKMYVFSNGTMSELAGYIGDFTCDASYYAYKTGDNEYKFFTENGTMFAQGVSKYVREVYSLNGCGYVEVNTGMNGTEYEFTMYHVMKS